MKSKRIILITLVAAFAVVLAACGAIGGSTTELEGTWDYADHQGRPMMTETALANYENSPIYSIVFAGSSFTIVSYMRFIRSRSFWEIIPPASYDGINGLIHGRYNVGQSEGEPLFVELGGWEVRRFQHSGTFSITDDVIEFMMEDGSILTRRFEITANILTLRHGNHGRATLRLRQELAVHGRFLTPKHNFVLLPLTYAGATFAGMDIPNFKNCTRCKYYNDLVVSSAYTDSKNWAK